MESLRIGRQGREGIAVFNPATTGRLDLPRWSVALEFGHALLYKAEGQRGPEPETVSGAVVRRENDEIVVSVDTLVFVVMPLGAAVEVALGIIGFARQIETEETYEDVVFDQAILDRGNFLPNLGLVSDPWLLNEAKKEAAWNSQLRRYLPGAVGVKRQRIVGTPQVEKETPDVR